MKENRRGQLFFALVACSCIMVADQVIGWPAMSFPMLKSGFAGFNLTDNEISWIATIPYFGNVLSPIPSGYMMDKIGRKLTLIIFTIFVNLSWGIICFTESFGMLCLARFILGVYSGVALTVLPVYVGEMLDPGLRGAMGALFGFMFYMSTFYETLAGFWTYKILNLISYIPSILSLIGLMFIPESPYFYIIHNEVDKAKKSIIFLKNKCDDELKDIRVSVKEQMEKTGNWSDIINTESAKKAFFTVELFAIIQRFAGATILFAYLTLTVPESFVTPTQCYIILCVVWSVTSLMSSYIIGKLGRRPLLFISCTGAGSTMLGVSIWFFLRDNLNYDMSTLTWIPVVLLIINGLFYSFGIVSIPNLLQSELFPINIKAKASAIVCITFATASGIAVKIFHPLANTTGVYMNFFICFIACFFGALLACFYLIETKGKTLEEIQTILEKRNKIDKTNDVL